MAIGQKGLVTIFGGSGFLGTQIVQELARRGYRIRVAVRRPDLAGHVRPLGSVGQIAPVQANVRNAESVRHAVQGARIVINLVGIIAEGGRQKFGAVQTEGARTVAEAARAAGAETLVHMSALGADPDSRSGYARSKALGEKEVFKAFPGAIVVRPSIMFGSGDGFISMFAGFTRFMPVLPVICGETRFQPVYVGDVAEAVALAVEGRVRTGKIYELGGPEILTMRQMLEMIVREVGRGNGLMTMPRRLAKFAAGVLQLLPKPLLTVDQVIQLGTDNVVSDAAVRDKRTLGAFGITPTTLDAIVPGYIWQYRKRGQFDRLQSS